MSPEEVAKTWVWKGLTDLYFAFEVYEYPFWNQAKFHEIMGLEKFLKALILFNKGDCYQPMTEQHARIEVDKMAKKLGHNYKSLIDDVDVIIGEGKISRLRCRDFDGYKFKQIVSAISAGYLEYRYPVPSPEFLKFQKGKGHYSDPLGSSGITKLVYELCCLCYLELQKNVDFGDILEIYENRYAKKESFRTFNTLFWQPGMNYQFGKNL